MEKEKKKTASKLFSVGVSNNFIIGLDGEGFVWVKPLVGSDREWCCEGRPPREDYANFNEYLDKNRTCF